MNTSNAPATGPTAYPGSFHAQGARSGKALTAPWRSGLRGLAGGSSLVRLLNEQRGKRKRLERPPLSEAQILQWADAYQARTGAWPVREAGPVAEMPDETWKAVDRLLRQGGRGLAGRTSLALLLA